MRIQPQPKALASAAALLTGAILTMAADAPGLRVPLGPESSRQPSPSFSLPESAGKMVRLEDYRGKVVLLDFWATWCTGCKKEIPWFSDFAKTYEAKGLAVVGVSLDEEGWKVLRPFLTDHPIPYTILLGDEATSKRFAIESMPDTFLIDRQGKVAAAYRGALVDRQDLETHLKALLAR